jgi:hypothetical protein
VRVEPVDERDSGWEDHAARYRVYLFSPTSSPEVWSAETWDLTETDVVSAMDWAQAHEPLGGLHALALVGEDPERGSGVSRGLTWLIGTDANNRRRTGDERRLYEVMVRRRRTSR